MGARPLAAALLGVPPPACGGESRHQLARRHTKRGASVPVHGFPQFVIALAEVDTLYRDAAANAVDDRLGALEARAAEIMALRDAGVTPDAYLVALDCLLAMMQAELSWLREFASALRSGQLEWRQAASDSKV